MDYWRFGIPTIHEPSIQLFYDSPTLLSHKLLHIIRPARAFAGAAAAFPTTEGIHPRPGTGGRTSAAIGVRDARLDVVEKVIQFFFVFGKNAGGQAVFRFVGESNSLLQ